MKRRRHDSRLTFLFWMALLFCFCSSLYAAKQKDYPMAGETLAVFAASCSGSYSTVVRTGPDSFDCSGFVYYVAEQCGVQLPEGDAQMQMGYGVPVDCTALKEQNDDRTLLPGDLIFFDYEGDGRANHVAIYLGNGTIRHCLSSGVCTTSLAGNFYKGDARTFYSVICGVRRILPRNQYAKKI